MSARRRAIVRVSRPFLEMVIRGELASGKQRLVATTMPADVKVIAIYQNPEEQRSDTFGLICESESFEPVTEGQILPDFVPEMTVEPA